MRQLTLLRQNPLPLLALSCGLAASAACGDDIDVVQLEAKMEVEPTLLDFGNVQIGTTITREILVRNTGDASLELEGVSRGPEFDEAFTYDIDRMVIVPNGVAVVTLNFSPVELGERIASLRVRARAANIDPISVEIIGTGVTTTLEVDPQMLSFGNVVVTTEKRLSVTLTNNSDIDASIEFIEGNNVRRCSGAPDSSVFCADLTDRQIGPDGRFQLRAGETTRMDVSFSPVIAGTRERGSLTLRACESSACEVEVRFDGLGIEQGFRCMPASVAFGQVNPGSCLTRTVSCENIANEQVTVVSWSGVTAGGTPTSRDFTFSNPVPQVLNEGDAVSVDVTYCPNDLGEDTGTLGIETDNRDPRLRTIFVPLSGTGGGPDIEVLPRQLNFGLVSLLAPARRTITIQNLGGDDLEVSEIIADVDGTGAFTAPMAAGERIPPNGFLDVTVEFQPVAEGPVESSLLVRSSDQDEPEVRVRLVGEGVNLPPCNFEVVPASLSFGAVERGRTNGRAFEIRNRGSSDCLVTSARLLPGSDVEFSMPEGDVTSEIIPGGSSTTIRVEFSPTQAGDSRGAVEFSISSPTTPFVEVPLSGTGVDSALLIVPNDLDFGTIGVGCRARARAITIYNTGATPAVINSIALATPPSAAFSVASVPAPLPGMALTLAPGASTVFEVGFQAAAMASYAGAVEISTTIGGQSVAYVVSLEGRGDVDATQIDEFQQLGRPRVDILFVIDDSCSMSQEQTALGANFAGFIQFAEAQALEYQLAVTTTDTSGSANAPNGRFVPVAGSPANRIVTPNSQPTPEAVFTMNTNVGINGSATERGLDAAQRALSNPLIFGHNAGFLRPDAVLSIIFVSDEPDQSSGAVDFYINFFLSIKGFRNTNLFTASAIAGGPTGCSGPGGSASASPRYIEVANRTGGVFQSICITDWAAALEDLSTTAFGFKSRFFLTNQPVVGTIRTFIDGMEIPATSPGGTVNWSYDYATNAVNFSPVSTPEPGADIRVEYTAECL